MALAILGGGLVMPDVAGAQPLEPDADSGDQGGDPAEPAGNEIDQAVAAALLQRAQLLFAQNDVENAKDLLIEALGRRPVGQVASDIIDLLRAANKQLGLPLDDGMSGQSRASSGSGTPEKPYGTTSDPFDTPGVGDGGEPVDPYGDGPGSDGDDVASADGAGDSDPEAEPDTEEPLSDMSDPAADDQSKARRTLLAYGGLYGFLTGMALAGPEDDFGEVPGSAVAAGLAVGVAGMLTGHYLAKKKGYTEAQSAVIGWSGISGGLAFAFFSDLATGIDDSSTNDIYGGIALGGLLGAGAGYLIADRIQPSVGDVSLVSSMGLYGLTGGLLLGAAMDPVETEAYSINALIGSAAGVAAGLYAAQRIDTTRERMVWIDAGAGAGALAPWLLIYPAVEGDGGTQTVGFLSLVGMFGGGYLAWRLTRDMQPAADDGGSRRNRGDEDDDDEDVLEEDEDEDEQTIDSLELARRRAASLPPPPGLIQRTADGRWRMGPPALRPAENPVLAPRTGKPGLALDVLSGRF